MRGAPELADGNPLDADYDDSVLQVAEDGHVWFRYRNRVIARAAIEAAVSFPAGGSLLVVARRPS